MNLLSPYKESDIKASIVSWLKLQPKSFPWVNHTTGIPNGKGGFRFNYQRGIADITGVKNGRAFAFEVKKPEGRVSEDQERWLLNFDAAGGYACVVRSLDDAIEAFGEI